MSRLRLLFLGFTLACGASLSVLLYRAEISVPFPATLAPAFQLLGRPIKSVDRALTRVLPVDEVDEAAYGDAIARRYEPYNAGTPEQQAYVQALISVVSTSGRKGFHYRAYLIETPDPNAFALPGGIVVVTTGLLSTVTSESELVGVLAHEVGHVELSHCLDSVRFGIAAQKISSTSLGELADLAMTIMMRHTFSKTQEEEADEYAWAWMLQSDYSLPGLGRAFGDLRKQTGASHAENPVSEYFQTHPYLELREDRYLERARVWRSAHPGQLRYVGKRNLRESRVMSENPSPYGNEWAED